MGNKIEKVTKIAIIGGGPAGISASIQLMRGGFDFILISENLGGTIRNANRIENLVGFPTSITGEEFVQLMKQQIEALNIPYLQEKVLSLQRLKKKYEIQCISHRIESDFVIVATGTTPRTLNIEGEKEAVAQGFLYYEISSLPKKCSDKSILIIGSGDIAYDYALHLQSYAKSIMILQRSRCSNALILLQQRATNAPNIKILKEKTVSQIKITSNMVQCMLESLEGIEIINIDVIVVAIGRNPNTSILSQELLGEWHANHKNETLHFVGDVHTGIFRQISIAIGEGMKAAMETGQIIQNQEK